MEATNHKCADCGGKADWTDQATFDGKFVVYRCCVCRCVWTDPKDKLDEYLASIKPAVADPEPERGG